MEFQKMSDYFRRSVNAMDGYAPGEQPSDPEIIKLNTNENPFPPSPYVERLLRSFHPEKLRLYPDPLGNELRDLIAETFCLKRENVILGNGSDDILTIAVRSFVDPGDSVACVEPSYSLYPVLAEIQGASCVRVPLDSGTFDLPDTLAGDIAGSEIIFIPRPNAPTGNSFAMDKMRRLCSEFDGIVLIDEAYADFAEDNCIGLINEFPNVIISRTLSKSYSLAGIRLGFALANPEIIDGMMKVKDSYNVNFITQELALAAMSDRIYFRKNIELVRKARAELAAKLQEFSFSIVPSQANFLFASPPGGKGREYFDFLRSRKILVRYFPGPVTGDYVRITVGAESEMMKLVRVTRDFVNM